MNCGKCSELLLDYLVSALGSEEMISVRQHLDGCPECSRELEELSVIKRAARGAAVPEPSAEVLSGLSAAARKSADSEKPSFWKKWAYSPVVVPALSAAIALSVWFYYGHYDINDIDTATRDMAASKAAKKDARGGGLSGAVESEETASTESHEYSDALMGEIEAREQMKPEGEEATAPLPAAAADISRDTASERGPAKGELRKKDISERDMVIYRKEKPSSSGLLERDPASNAPGEISGKLTAEGVLKTAYPEDYNSRLQLALRQQTEGDCVTSIKTNESLLNSSPLPPRDVQADSYKSLAECYEQTGELDKASASYKNLGLVDPSQSGFVNEKLEEMKIDAAYMNYEGTDTGKEPAK